MRVDPRSCKCEVKENLLWALLHDIIIHPMLGFTFYRANWAIALHDYTSHKAWPRSKGADLRVGVWYRSAVSGLYYSSRRGAGFIDQVLVDGTAYTRDEASDE